MTAREISSPCRKRSELLMAGVYVALTIYLLFSGSAPSICRIVDAAVRPFQVTIRARHAGAERTAIVWRLAQSEKRTRRGAAEMREWPDV